MNLLSISKKWWVLAGVSIASFLGCIDFTIVNTALPAIQTSLVSTMTQLQWIVNIFILALSTCMVIMGRLADIYGRRLLLYCGMIGFGLSSLCAGFANNIDTLILFRLIQGIACAILYTASGAIISNAFPANERGKAIGALFGVNGVGLAIGPVLGGLLVSALSWRWVFFINVPFILLSMLICFMSVNESRNDEGNSSIDWLGLLALVIALPCLVLSITQGDQWGWLSAQTIFCFGLSIIMFVVFYFIEARASSPIIEFHLFINRTFIVSVLATAALAFFYCVAFFLMPLYLHLVRGEQGYMLGLMLLPITATVAIISPIVGRVVDKVGAKMPMAFGMGFFIVSALIQTTFNGATPISIIMLAFVIMGLGWACILGPSTVAALSSVPDNAGAVAMGSSWTLHNVGGAIGLALGLEAYRVTAQNNLISNLSEHHIANNGWVKNVIINPENGIQLLQQHLTQGKILASDLFQQFFIAGYKGAMELLVISSLLAFLIIIFGMKKT
jgi:EmrB/QacA subfamily drug resistance transporter